MKNIQVIVSFCMSVPDSVKTESLFLNIPLSCVKVQAFDQDNKVVDVDATLSEYETLGAEGID